MNDDTNQKMLHILALAPSANLQFSTSTRKWYVQARIEVGDGTMLRGITEHRDSPEAAVDAFFARLTEIGTDHFLVTKPYGGPRRHWRWNGAAFAEEPIRTPEQT